MRVVVFSLCTQVSFLFLDSLLQVQFAGTCSGYKLTDDGSTGQSLIQLQFDCMIYGHGIHQALTPGTAYMWAYPALFR